MKRIYYGIEFIIAFIFHLTVFFGFYRLYQTGFFEGMSENNIIYSILGILIFAMIIGMVIIYIPHYLAINYEKNLHKYYLIDIPTNSIDNN